jgi:fatty acid desaturase
MEHRGIKVRPVDWLWAAVAGLAACLLVATIWAWVAGSLRAGLLVLAGILLAQVWFLLGSWRRTVWGAPAAGQRDHRELRHLDRRRSADHDQ